MTRIKICGNTRPEDVELAVELGADLLGFIFTRSKRQISIEKGKALTADIPESVGRVVQPVCADRVPLRGGAI